MNDDTISRQAAIDALIELTIQRDKWDDKEGFAQKRGIDAAICAIEDLPSAERHGRWIPITDRLPEQEGQYLVCCNNKHHQFEVARFYINYDGDRWFCCDWNDPEKIIAWMPLPEPYKGGVEE